MVGLINSESEIVMARVLTIGVYDLTHYGHFELFRRAKELAGPNGELIVGVQDDEHVAKWKPKTHLIYNYEIRKSLIGAIKYVDRVVRHTDAYETVKSVDFDVFCVGAEQSHPGFQRAIAWCETNGKQIYRMPRTNGISTTELKNRIKEEC